MSQDASSLASAINLSDIEAHPTEAIATLIELVRRQGEIIREHEARLDKHSEYITELRFEEDPEPTPNQRDRKEVLIALLTLNQGKMLAKDARTRMRLDKATFSRLLAKMQDSVEVRPLRTNRRNNLLVLRSAKG